MEKPRFGTLVVIVDRARNLPNRKKIGKQDAYAIVRLGHEVQRTPTDKRAGQVPNWNHEVRFQVPNEEENILKISIFNEDSKVPDLIGDCAIDLSDLYKKHEYDNWFDLKYKDKPAGEIYAELTFYYEGPPRPKPKVDLTNLQSTARPQSAGPAGRGLPSIPPTSDAMLPPARQRTMSPTPRSPLTSTRHDLIAGMDRLHMHDGITSDDFGYTNSPYQQGVRYAETWTGERDDRIISPAPGDVRRKSISSEAPRIVANNLARNRAEAERYAYSPGPRRNSYVDGYDRQPRQTIPNAHRYAASQSHVTPERFLAQQNNSRNRYGQQSPEIPYGTRSGPGSPVHVSHLREDDHVQYVDPILDPRHGSPHELRGSPSIVAPRPDYLAHDRNIDQLRHTQSESIDYGYEPADRSYQVEPDSCPPQSGGYSHADVRRINKHTQAQSMSYASPQRFSDGRDEMQWSQPQVYHNKAASTSAMHSPGRSSFASQPEGDHRSREPRKSIDRPAHGYDVSQQRRNTYAVTPAQYAAQNRPLPVAPDAPPALPAKIPLGLTQEEYDILYGR